MLTCYENFNNFSRPILPNDRSIRRVSLYGSGEFCIMENEEWRDVVGYEGIYRVSRVGVVHSLERVVKHLGGSRTAYERLIKGGIVKQRLDWQGYSRVQLCYQGTWATHSENTQHAYDTGLLLVEKGANNKLSMPISQYDIEGVLIRNWEGARQAERETGFLQGNISRCVRGQYKQAYGFIWKKSI